MIINLKTKLFIVFLIAIMIILSTKLYEVKYGNLPLEQQQTTVSSNYAKQLRIENQFLQNKVERLESELSTLKSDLDISNWQEQDILSALAKFDESFLTAKTYDYLYNDDGTYYKLHGQTFDQDPFYQITYSYIDEESEIGHFRMFKIGEQNFQTYLDKINKELQIDQDLICDFENECNFALITCFKKDQKMTIWFENNYLFTTRNDDKVYETFKEFYCASDFSIVTANIIKDNEIIDSLKEVFNNIFA